MVEKKKLGPKKSERIYTVSETFACCFPPFFFFKGKEIRFLPLKMEVSSSKEEKSKIQLCTFFVLILSFNDAGLVDGDLCPRLVGGNGGHLAVAMALFGSSLPLLGQSGRRVSTRQFGELKQHKRNTNNGSYIKRIQQKQRPCKRIQQKQRTSSLSIFDCVNEFNKNKEYHHSQHLLV